MKPQFIDIHAHTNFADFDLDRAEVVKRALDLGVWMINVGTGQATSKNAVDMTREFPQGVYAIVGLHPIYVPEEEFDAGFYRTLAESSKKVVGIGECGLDYVHATTAEAKAKQEKTFRAHIDLALELDLPLMLHIRSGVGGNAYRDALDILKEYKAKLVVDGQADKLRGDAHFYAGSADEGREFIALGFYLSFTGVVTFAKQYVELVIATPDDRIMSETDCPYVAPVPERGKRNEPSFVIHTAAKIAALKGANPAEFQKQLVENASRLFNLS